MFNAAGAGLASCLAQSIPLILKVSTICCHLNEGSAGMGGLKESKVTPGHRKRSKICE